MNDSSQEISKAFGFTLQGASKRAYVLIDQSARIRYIWISSDLDVFECLINLQMFQSADEKVLSWIVDYEGQEEPEEDNKFEMLLIRLRMVSFAESEEIDITDYLKIFEYLQQFLKLVGLNWLARDTKLKSKIVQDLRKKKGLLYETVNSVLMFEKMTETSKGHLSGTNNLLRLHRILEFVMELLTSIEGLGESERIGKAVKEGYRKSLMLHDSCCLRTFNLIAIHHLPQKSKLTTKLILQTPENLNFAENRSRVRTNLAMARDLMKAVEEKMSKAFKKYGIKL